MVHDHFSAIFVRGPRQYSNLHWEAIAKPNVCLHALDDPFSQPEVRDAIGKLPGDKTPNPDGFTGAFFKSAWHIIKADFMAMVHFFKNLHYENLQCLNSANISLIPEKNGA